MSETTWIVIPRWEEFQHRDAARVVVPTWVKTYTRLLSDDDYLSLSAGERALLHGLWLEYARAHRQIPVRCKVVTGSVPAEYEFSTNSLSRRLHLRVTSAQLKRLNRAGFIQFSASKPASTAASTDAGIEKRREEKKRGFTKGPSSNGRGWTCTHEEAFCGHPTFPTETKLREHLANLHWTYDHHQDPYVDRVQ